MNARTRALNVWNRYQAGKVGPIEEIARALAEAHRQGFREGAVAMLEPASKLDISLSQKERTHALVDCFYTVTGMKRR